MHVFFERLLDAFWNGFGSQNGRKIDPKTVSKTCWNRSWSKGSENTKTDTPHSVFEGFSSQVGSQIYQKSMKNQSQKSIVFRSSFWIDFLTIFCWFWSHLGGQHGAKIDEKRCWKNCEKTMTNKMAKKSNIGAYEWALPGDPGANGRGVNHSSREVGGSWKIELNGWLKEVEGSWKIELIGW